MNNNPSETRDRNASLNSSDRLDQANWETLKAKTHERDEYQCVNCGSKVRLEAHHVVPLSIGGENVLSNIVTLCRSCHLKAENKRERNDQSSLEAEKEYQNLITPHEASSVLRSVHHPLTRVIVTLHSYYGIGAGEVCNLSLSDYTTSNEEVASAFELDISTSPALEIALGRENSSTRTRSNHTILPLIPEVESQIIRYLAIRPDSNHDQLFFGTVERWGKPLTRDLLTYDLKSRTGNRPQAYINCFKKYAPVDQYTKRYLLSGDRDEIDAALEEGGHDGDPYAYLRGRYCKYIYDLFDIGTE